MWLLIRYPGGAEIIFKLSSALQALGIETIKRDMREDGLRILAVYRRKVREPREDTGEEDE